MARTLHFSSHNCHFEMNEMINFLNQESQLNYMSIVNLLNITIFQRAEKATDGYDLNVSIVSDEIYQSL